MKFLEGHFSKIAILDIGARVIESDPPVYTSLMDSYNCHVTAIEADESACKDISKSDKTTVINVALGDGKQQTFNICALKSCSSLLYPNLEQLANFSGMKQFYQVVKTEYVKTRKLDEIGKGEIYDFLKIDIQGYELEVLKYDLKMLLDLSSIHIEVSFIQKYINQPLFRDVDCFLSKLGFTFHCFTGYGTRTPKTIYTNNNPIAGINQWLWADAFYFKDLNNDHFWDYKDRLIKLALVCHYIYQSYDYAAYALKKYDNKNHTFYLNKYLMFLKTNKLANIQSDIDEDLIINKCLQEKNKS